MKTPSEILDASLDEQAVDLDELERLTRDYMAALERGCPMDGGIPLVTAFAKQGGEHRVILKLLALARRALAPEAKGERKPREHLWNGDDCELCGADRYCSCNCDPLAQTGGGHAGSCPCFAPECTCYELTGGHQPGCHFNALPRSLAITPDVHRRRSEMCERLLREHGEQMLAAIEHESWRHHHRGGASDTSLKPTADFEALMKEFGIGGT